MDKKSLFSTGRKGLFFSLLFIGVAFVLNSCGGSSAKTEAIPTDDDAFYSTQPLHSGLYDADYYDITGPNARKGKFDGRIYFSLSPKTSGINVFENGNRTKIDYIVGLEKPFEKDGNGLYVSTDMKGKPVSVCTDSSSYVLSFIHFNDTVQIGFSPKARHLGSAIDILEKMNERKSKK